MDTEGGATDRGTELHARLIDGLLVKDLRFDLAGVRTAVLEAGEGSPMVLLHGQGGFAAMWGPLIAMLSGTRHVIAPDLPGLGRSEVGSGRLDESGIVTWLDELIAKTCDEAPVLVGHSLGGSIAMRYAVRHPERLRRLVLINPGSLAPFRPSPKLLYALIRMTKRPSLTALRRMQRHIFVEPERAMSQMGPRREIFEAYQIDRASQPGISRANRTLLRNLAGAIPEDQLSRIPVPVSMIWGREDKIMRFGAGVNAAARFGWELHPIEAAAHVPMVEQPAAFVGAFQAATGG